MAQYRIKLIPMLAGVILSLFMTILLFTNSGPIVDWIEFIDNKIYDFQLRRIYQPLSNHPDVIIVGLDDKSLKTEGRLPWTRDKMGSLIDRLTELGAKVVAFDFMFPAPEENIASTVVQEFEKKGERLANEEILQVFDFDAVFAKSLEKADSILGMVLTENEESLGILPPPILTLNTEEKSIYIPEKNSYLGNIPILQKAAKWGGFINSMPDRDSIIRQAPLIYRLGSDIYGSLALVATIEFLKVQKVKLIAKPYGGTQFLEAIQLDFRSIPVDPLAKILVPYRGPALSFSFLSATDVLHGAVSPDSVRGKLVFIGATATGSGDLVSTPISQTYNGVEVHATIAQGIIDQYLPSKPGWEKGVSVAMVLIFGLCLAIYLPQLGPFPMVSVSAGSILSLLLLDFWMWKSEKLVLTFFFPILAIGLIFLLNVVYGFILEAKQRQAIKNVFGQYVSSDYIDMILKKGEGIEMGGESKVLSVLFADIRGFTTLSETMSAQELTSFLNIYFTEMTEEIFQHKGTIDKYIGDAIMAFWGAPMEDANNPYDAVSTALAMQKRLETLNQKFASEKRPTIQIGIGIATGDMYVGDMGSKFRRSYTVMGDTVNLSSRLEGLTKYYHVKIIVSEKTYLATRDHFLYKKLDKVQVKGKEQAVEIYESLCFAEEATSEMKEEIDSHHLALEAYAQGNWDTARQIWQKLQDKGQNKDLYAMYLGRMKTPSPKGPNWDGVQRYEIK